MVLNVKMTKNLIDGHMCVNERVLQQYFRAFWQVIISIISRRFSLKYHKVGYLHGEYRLIKLADSLPLQTPHFQ